VIITFRARRASHGGMAKDWRWSIVSVAPELVPRCSWPCRLGATVSEIAVRAGMSRQTGCTAGWAAVLDVVAGPAELTREPVPIGGLGDERRRPWQ